MSQSISKTPRYRYQRITKLVFVYLILAALTAFFMLPFYTMIVASFMDNTALNSVTPHFWPKPAILDNYKALFSADISGTTFFRALLNSMLLAVGQTVPAVLIASLVGFIFAKRDFPGKNALFIAVLITMMLPYQATIVPFFLLMTKLKWINTFLPLWIPWWAPAFGIFLMRQIIVATVPDSLIDAATIDGASILGIYWRIILPLVKPGLAVLGILNFMNAWNDYIYSNIIFNDVKMYTVPLVLAFFQGSQLTVPQHGLMAAGSVVGVLPLVGIFFLFQRWLVSGIMAGAMKG
jgi:ABC-type glycerol-3-phosphate transport system permease component